MMASEVVGLRAAWVKRGAVAAVCAVALAAGPAAMAGAAQAGALLVAQADTRPAPVAGPSAPVQALPPPPSGLQPETRAEFVGFLGFLLFLPPGTQRFSDVPASAWYAGPVAAAASAGIVKGLPGGKFDPNAPVTQAQAAVFAARAIRLAEALHDVTGVAVPATVRPATGVPAWAARDVALVRSAGVSLPTGHPDAALSGASAGIVLTWFRIHVAPCVLHVQRCPQ